MDEATRIEGDPITGRLRVAHDRSGLPRATWDRPLVHVWIWQEGGGYWAGLISIGHTDREVGFRARGETPAEVARRLRWCASKVDVAVLVGDTTHEEIGAALERVAKELEVTA